MPKTLPTLRLNIVSGDGIRGNGLEAGEEGGLVSKLVDLWFGEAAGGISPRRIQGLRGEVVTTPRRLSTSERDNWGQMLKCPNGNQSLISRSLQIETEPGQSAGAEYRLRRLVVGVVDYFPVTGEPLSNSTTVNCARCKKSHHW